jgi:hypothetical protein
MHGDSSRVGPESSSGRARAGIALTALALLAACAPAGRAPPPAERVQPGAPAAAAGSRFRIDAARSELRILVYRAGPLARLGHNHVLRVRDLQGENAILIGESDPAGKKFFRDFYQSLHLTVHEYSFEEHDRTIAYSLSVPFISTLVFAACMKKQKAPGTTFRKHMDIARGLFSEDDQLLTEILFNPATVRQIERINSQLSYLTHIIRERDSEEMKKFLDKLRRNIT